ncbi:MAG: hypothetical protein WAW23_05825 [Candidatus Methanoperedens sp.]
MNTFVKMIVVIILVIAALTGVFYIEGSNKSAKIANINVWVEIAAQNGSVRITNIEGSLEDISKVGLPVGGSLEAPGIAVSINQEKKPVSDWYSLLLMNDSRIYNFRIGLYDAFSEDKNVSVYVQAVDRRNNEIMSAQKELLLNRSIK